MKEIFSACISVRVYAYCERISVTFVLTMAIQFKTTGSAEIHEKSRP